MQLAAELHIDRLGRRGEGVARGTSGPIYVPYALAGETVIAEVDGERGRLVQIIEPTPERIAPFCPYYARCGGCAVQTLPAPSYAAWKRDGVTAALVAAGLPAVVGPLVDAHGLGRRRASFHARRDSADRLELGFMAVRSHDIVAIDSCPLFAPEMAGAIDAARAVAAVLVRPKGSLDVHVTATDTGLDIDLQGHGLLSEADRRRVVKTALAFDLARLSNHGPLILEPPPPRLQIGPATLVLPPGGFLQATAKGEEAIASRVAAALGGAERIVDLFAGVGPFTLRLLARSSVHAVDVAAPPLAALANAAKGLPRARPVTTATRDLFKRPLDPRELAAFDAAVFDPPRAGASAQAAALAASPLSCVVAVSCKVETFCRDAALLVGGGFTLESVEAIDQFRHSPHIEIVAVFRRPVAKQKPKRNLLG